MSTQKRKFELFSRLQALGFTYEEAAQLRRIEMTLSRWSEAECNGEIERNETTGKPERVSQAWINGASDKRHAWPVADREAGALRRLADIMRAHRALWFYHQGDPRGCSLYVGRKSDLPKIEPAELARLCGENAAKTRRKRRRLDYGQRFRCTTPAAWPFAHENPTAYFNPVRCRCVGPGADAASAYGGFAGDHRPLPAKC